MLQAAAQIQIAEGFNLESWLRHSKLQEEYVSPVLRPFHARMQRQGENR